MPQHLNWAISSKVSNSSHKYHSSSNSNRKVKLVHNISIDSTNKRRLGLRLKVVNNRRCSKASFIRSKQRETTMKTTIRFNRTYTRTFPQGTRNQHLTSSARLWQSRVLLLRSCKLQRQSLRCSSSSIPPTNPTLQAKLQLLRSHQSSSIMVFLIATKLSSPSPETKLSSIWMKMITICSQVATAVIS